MKNITKLCVALLLLGRLGVNGAAAAAEPLSAKQAFEVMKSLAGDWTGKMQEGGEQPDVKVLYRVTAAQSAVVETLFPGQPHEMITVYHLDGDKLVLTHYCAAGNQPHMALTRKSTANDLIFDFVSGSNMNPKKDAHMHSAHLHLEGTDTLSAEWTGYKEGKPDHSAKFALNRKKDATAAH